MSDAAEKAPKKSWFKGLKAEYKKIIWPDKKSLTKQTIAVVATSVALGIIIKILDVIMRTRLRPTLKRRLRTDIWRNRS